MACFWQVTAARDEVLAMFTMGAASGRFPPVASDSNRPEVDLEGG